ncbi:MAG: cAMP protein kinase regulatory chain [Myxococcales bacterium]|nr:cAMP protein kinase regulatory chain [Myxococcales bacterium]
MGAATTANRIAAGAITRSDERALVVSAGAVFALASAGAAMTAAAADAMFLSEVGPGQLGQAVAASSALLAIVLAVVGGLSDRLERRRVLASLAMISAVVVAALAALSLVSARGAAVITLIGGKQLAAATDLAFWVVIAERIDARRSQRMLPILAAMGGAGAAAGALLVIPIASATGPRGVLVCAAAVLAVAGVYSLRLPVTRTVAATRIGAPAGRQIGGLIARSWRDGARTVRRHPLARHLAVVVGAAGVFGSLAYFALGVEVAARGNSVSDVAALLGAVRGGGQFLTLIVQLAATSKILARIGTGRTLLFAPLVALASACGLVVAPILAVAIATQISARVLDASLETPAEKLAQTLLPSAVRGRVAGFLDGTAKRAGAVLGGLIAAMLVGAPSTFYIVTAVAAALWFLAARRIARELPALAIEQAAHATTDDSVVDDRAIAVLLRELDGPRPERAAEVLARLHDRGRVDAVAPLARAAIASGAPSVWRSLVTVLELPAEAHGTALLEAAQAAPSRIRELAVRAVGLAGGVSPDAVEQWRDVGNEPRHIEPALALTAEVARARLAGESVIAIISETIREAGPAARAASDELAIEIARALAAANADRALEAARHLQRALRRGRGDITSRTAAFAMLARVIAWARPQRSAELSLLRSDLLELARERVEAGASKPAPETALVSLMRKPTGGATADEGVEIAAALRLYGALLEGADAVEPDDLRRVARALGEPDDDVRAAAEDALSALGPAAAGELIATAAWGRRRARDRAAALLADLPVTATTIDRLVDAELDALDQTAAAIAVIGVAETRREGRGTAPLQLEDELIIRRLEERLREIAHTVLLLVAARRRSREIATAAVAWRHARGAHERARTLAVIETALPRPLVSRLVDAVDELTPADRAASLARAGVELPAREAIVRSELAGRDRLSRALVMHSIGAAGRSAHRETISNAARAEALATSPLDLLRRISEAVDDPVEEGAHDMPSRVETLIALGRVPLLAALSTRQLADVAERARWTHAREGTIVITGGDPIDALIVLDDGELQLGDRRIVKGEVVDELACVAPLAAIADLTVVRAARMIRLERVDFEELVDDVPGLASAVCRALGERARRAEDTSYRSPLASRG